MKRVIRSADQVVNIFRSDPGKVEELKKNPLVVLGKVSKLAKETTPAYIGDVWLYRIAIVILGALSLITALGSVYLLMADRGTPEILIALGSAALGAIVGLFAPSPVK